MLLARQQRLRLEGALQLLNAPKAMHGGTVAGEKGVAGSFGICCEEYVRRDQANFLGNQLLTLRCEQEASSWPSALTFWDVGDRASWDLLRRGLAAGSLATFSFLHY